MHHTVIYHNILYIITKIVKIKFKVKGNPNSLSRYALLHT